MFYHETYQNEWRYRTNGKKKGHAFKENIVSQTRF